jgi:hypothetical protein
MLASVPFKICFLNIQNLHLSKDRNNKLTLIDWLLSNYRREGWIRMTNVAKKLTMFFRHSRTFGIYFQHSGVRQLERSSGMSNVQIWRMMKISNLFLGKNLVSST